MNIEIWDEVDVGRAGMYLGYFEVLKAKFCTYLNQGN